MRPQSQILLTESGFGFKITRIHAMEFGLDGSQFRALALCGWLI